jgi:hypothetical protein
VEFADKATRALGIEHTPFEAEFGFSLEEPLIQHVTLNPGFARRVRAVIGLLFEVHAMVRSVLHVTSTVMQ